MANTYSQLYIQCVFAVKYSGARIKKEWKQTLLGVIGNLINQEGCKTLIVNGVEDHVHCFLGLTPSVSVSDLMKKIKAKSSKYINDHNLTCTRFEWQVGYGVFSYGHSQINDVHRYVSSQEQHHKKQSFKEEYLAFLEKFEIPYDDRYVFHDMI
jgi:putative transposase